jgi:ribosomal protein S27AE
MRYYKVNSLQMTVGRKLCGLCGSLRTLRYTCFVTGALNSKMRYYTMNRNKVSRGQITVDRKPCAPCGSLRPLRYTCSMTGGIKQ